jgi:hypothetical protein
MIWFDRPSARIYGNGNPCVCAIKGLRLMRMRLRGREFRSDRRRDRAGRRQLRYGWAAGG